VIGCNLAASAWPTGSQSHDSLACRVLELSWDQSASISGRIPGSWSAVNDGKGYDGGVFVSYSHTSTVCQTDVSEETRQQVFVGTLLDPLWTLIP
jgi:hypothetical protein